jgi:basic membrane protein A and related proteins
MWSDDERCNDPVTTAEARGDCRSEASRLAAHPITGSSERTREVIALHRSYGVTMAAAIAAGALVLASCGSKSASTGSSATTSGGGGATSAATSGAAASFKGCMVTDTGGIDDRSFNASAWQGMLKAQSDGKATVKYVQSKTATDYVPNISSLLSEKCNLIVTVGGLMATATTNAAKANPSQNLAEVDAPGNGKNLQGLQYNTAQGAFLGGYLAAAYSKSGVVATYGGLKIPPVTIYMDGFQEGVNYYNQQNGKSVKVLGWDEKTQNGSFAGSFTDQTKGQTLATNFINQGADVIFPVAGLTGVGSAAATKASGKAVVIWVDTDGCISAPQYCTVFLTSVVKGIADSVTKAVESAASGNFTAKDYIGDLSNGGTGLAPFHNFDSKVPANVKSKLDSIKQDIISGKIKITSPSQPKAAS